MSACPYCKAARGENCHTKNSEWFLCGTRIWKDAAESRYGQSRECAEAERGALLNRITTLQTQLDQRWEMMRELEAECGTKDVAEAVKYIKGLKALVAALEKAGDVLDNHIACGCGVDGPCRHCAAALDGWSKAKGQQ